MMKHVIFAIVLGGVCLSDASAESLLKRSDWQDRKIETLLPPLQTSIPWLEIDTRIKSHTDTLLGRDLRPPGPFVLPEVNDTPNVAPRYRDSWQFLV